MTGRGTHGDAFAQPGRASTGRVGQHPYLANSRGGHLEGQPLGIAHRGFAPGGEENSLKAFAAAVEQGCVYLELDVRTTADGHLLVFHDEDLDSLTNGSGAVSSQTLDEIRRVRVSGEPLVSLEDLFMAAASWPRVRFNIDIKDQAGATLLAEAVHRHGLGDRVLVASFSDGRRRRCLERWAELEPDSPPLAQSPGQGLVAATVGLVASRIPTTRWPRAVRRRLEGISAFQVPASFKGVPVVTPRFISAAHELGVQVHVWTVNDKPEMERLLDLGVDGIVTDRIDLLSEILSGRGAWPQG